MSGHLLLRHLAPPQYLFHDGHCCDVLEQMYHRWKKKNGGMKAEEARRLKELEEAYLRQMAQQGSRASVQLLRFKDNMEKPISAILIVNTIAGTAGAAVAGAQAQVLFGEVSLIWYSLALTLCVLFFSEIFPKVVGVAYSQSVSRAIAIPWATAVTVLFPVVWVIEKLSSVLKPAHSYYAPEDELHQFAMISAEEGSIMPHEAALVRNALRLDKVMTRDIMTARSAVMKLRAEMTLREAFKQPETLAFSRIPVYSSDAPDEWRGIVFNRDILAALARDQFEVTIESLCTPTFFVSECTPCHVLLKTFIKRRVHLFGVVDKHGDVAGIVTLEDVLESLLGEEIVDESDAVVDIRKLATSRNHEGEKQTTRNDAG